MAKDNSGYILTRAWFNFVLDNPDIVTGNHTALFMWIIELNNRLKWVDKFGLTVREAMDGMSCKSRTTYLKCFHDLIGWQFIEMVKQSKNQYQCNIIAVSKFVQPNEKRLYKKYTITSQSTGTITSQSTGTIPKTVKTVKTVKTTKQLKHREGFTPPIFNDVFDYFIFKEWPENKADNEAKKFIAYYDSVGWIIKKQKMKSWKGAAAGWMLRDNEFSQKKINNGSKTNQSGNDTINRTNLEYVTAKYGDISNE